MEQKDIFALFDEVQEVNGLQSYDEHDQTHLQSIYRAYLAERKYLAELKNVEDAYLAVMEVEKKNFSDYFFHLAKTPDAGGKAFCEANESFIKNCTQYLESRHGCTIPAIENPDRRVAPKSRYGEDIYNFAGEEIRLEDVVDRILASMGGHDFKSMRDQEIKTKFREKFGCRNDRVSQKSSTLTFDMWGSFYEQGYCDSDHYRIRYNYHDEMKALADGIRLFGGDSSKSSWTAMFPEEGDQSEIFSPMKIWNVKGVSSVRFFKNGRIDIKFEDAKLATEFTRFFGIILASTKAS